MAVAIFLSPLSSLIILITLSLCLAQWQFNLGIPTCQQLKSAGILNTSFYCHDRAGSCLEFNTEFPELSRCGYYGNCCPSAPVLTSPRLDSGSYSCHEGFYIIDGCPQDFLDLSVKHRCESTPSSFMEQLSAIGWPVYSTNNGLFYKNIHCALCNGLDPTLNSGNNPLFDWPVAELKVDQDRINSNLSFMEILKSKDVNLVYYLSHPIDSCQVVEKCPSDTGQLMSELCRRAPRSTFTDGKGKYRNEYCAACNGVPYATPQTNTIGTDSIEITAPLVITLNRTTNSFMPARNSERLNTTLAIVKMIEKKSNLNSAMLISNFSTIQHEMCYNETCMPRPVVLRSPVLQLQDELNNQVALVWNLGSYECYSPFAGVCNQFMLFSNSSDCQRPGCPKGKVPNLEDKNCEPLDRKTTEVQDGDQDQSQKWEFTKLCSLLSHCTVSAENRNCFCDNSCTFYGDCCYDASDLSKMEKRSIRATSKCVEVKQWKTHYGFRWGYQEINGCPEDYSDSEIKNLCLQQSENVGISHVPVSDLITGVRYMNVFCAQCNGVARFEFWNQEVRCLDVTFTFDSEKQHLLPQFMYNISSEDIGQNIKNRHCRVNWKEPVGLPTRRCRIDSEQIINTCPLQADNPLSQKCLEEPTSFVWDLQSNASSIPKARYRNSHCALCNGLERPGCVVTSVFDAQHGYEFETKGLPTLFLYEIDFNRRTCLFDSEIYLTFEMPDTGRDSCAPLQTELNSCGCKSVYDLDSKTCVGIDYHQTCTNFTVPEPQPSTYSKSANCEDLRGIFSNRSLLANIDCTSVTENAEALISQDVTFTPSHIPQASFEQLYCASRQGKLVRCPTKAPQRPSWIVNGFIDFFDPHHTMDDESVITINPPVTASPPILVEPPQIRHRKNNECNFGVNVTAFDDVVFCLEDGIVVSFGNTSQNIPILSLYFSGSHICYTPCTLDPLNMDERPGKYPQEPLDWLHYSLIGISLCSIVVYFVVTAFQGRKSISILFFRCLIGTLAVGLLTFSLKRFGRTSNHTCIMVAVILQYFLISVHTWTLAYAIRVYSVVSKFEKFSKSIEMSVVIKYATFAWGTPFGIVILTLCFHFGNVKFFEPVFDMSDCSLNSYNSHMVLLMAPIYLAILFNIILCVVIMCLVSKSSKISNNDRKRAHKNIFICVKLFMVLGVYWVLLVLLHFKLSKQSRYILKTILSIIVELQGFLVVLAYSLKLRHLEKLSCCSLFTLPRSSPLNLRHGVPSSQEGSDSNIGRK